MMRIRTLLAVIALPMIVGVAIWSAHEVSAACSIHFDNAITSWTTNSAGSFGTIQTPESQVRVDYNSSGQTPWTLYGSETPGNSLHLATQSVQPAYRTVSLSGMNFTTFTIIGSLETGEPQGLYQLSCWDGDFWACSDSHNVTINRP